ncbi:hypothetical protein [Nakamurella lactea]|uniref:hypothetical protein n=1 Tax=Nakamurella lactea TaxID=459515 RepID=UPI000404A860|nr:hypothetical protein [Nakamurella lactea]
MAFFPEPSGPPEDDELFDEPQGPVWLNPPEDVLPGVVPLELVLGRSDSTVVMLSEIRAFSQGLQMQFAVRVRGRLVPHDLHSEVFRHPGRRGTVPRRNPGGLQWGFEFADGRRVTNVDAWPDTPPDDRLWTPDHPVLVVGGGGGGMRSVDTSFWLWPLPPAGPMKVACQWTDQGIEFTEHDLDTQLILDAAARARSAWDVD